MGIDGGGTGCRAVLADTSGAVLGRGAAGPANVMSDPDGTVAAILSAAHDALAGRDPGACVACLGLAGAEVSGAADWLPARLPFARVRVVQDAEAATVGALAGADGIVAAIGTGSVFSRQIGGAITIIGGRGPVLGDEGSGAWLGRRLLARALRAHDGIDPHSPATRRVLDDLGGVGGVIGFARQATGADFAAHARRLADDPGDAAARDLLAAADAEIATFVARLQPGDAVLPVTFTGGLGPLFAARLADRWPQRAPLGSPLDGALHMARAMRAGDWRTAMRMPR